jgi:hypothetical protein
LQHDGDLSLHIKNLLLKISLKSFSFGNKSSILLINTMATQDGKTRVVRREKKLFGRRKNNCKETQSHYWKWPKK